MKKLTAGVFATLLTLVGVGAANAEIASKAYVDQQDEAVSATVTALGTKVTANEGAISGLNTRVTDNKTALDTLNGDASTTGSVAKAAADTLASAKSYADGLGTKYATAAQGALADSAVQPAAIADMETKTHAAATYATKDALTTGLATKQNKLTNQANGTANVVIDDATGKISLQGIATDTALNDLTTRVTTAESDIDALETGKADKAETLAGYGITNAYTKAETDAAVKVASDAANAAQTTANARLANVTSDGTGTVVKGAAKDGTNVKVSLGTIATDDIDNGAVTFEKLNTNAVLGGEYDSNMAPAVKTSKVPTVELAENMALAAASSAIGDTVQPLLNDKADILKNVGTKAGNIATVDGEGQYQVSDTTIASLATAASVTALDEKVTSNTNAITTLNGTGAGSVSQAVSTAIDAEVTRSNAAYAVKGTETVASDAKTSATTANTTANANKAAIATLNANAQTEGSVDYKIAQAQTSLGADISGVEAIANANKAAIENTSTGLAAAHTAAANAQTAANAAKTAADKAQETADKMIPKPTADCTALGAKCVLVVGTSGYAWEVVQRATDGQ